MSLPPGLLHPPIAHRGLWSANGAPENSLLAFERACRAGYGLELDVRLSADGEAMVFHDEKLERMTGAPGTVQEKTAAELGALPLKGGPARIPTLAQALATIAGRGLLLGEIKAIPERQDALNARTAALLDAYAGPFGVVSFDAGALAWFAEHRPAVPRGLNVAHMSDAELDEEGPQMEARLDALIAEARPDFLNLQIDTAKGRLAARRRANGFAVAAWVVRSAEEAASLAPYCDNIIFEGFSA